LFSDSDNHFSSLLSDIFARVIDIRPDIVILLREVGLVYLDFDVLFLLLLKNSKKK
jgi:hypothetical protein